MDISEVPAEVYEQIRQQVEDEFYQYQNEHVVPLHVQETVALSNWIGELSRVHEVIMARGLPGKIERLTILVPRLEAAETRFLDALRAWRDLYLSMHEPNMVALIFEAIESVRATSDSTKAIANDIFQGMKVDLLSVEMDIGVSSLDQMFTTYIGQLSLGGRPRGMSPELERLLSNQFKNGQTRW
jgi:hypothetical protein